MSKEEIKSLFRSIEQREKRHFVTLILVEFCTLGMHLLLNINIAHTKMRASLPTGVQVKNMSGRPLWNN